MYDRTLVIWASDNGGAVHLGGGANSWPLRGGYFSNWEGGVRTAALVSGGFLPPVRRGKKLVDEMVHIADWYATFCGLAGVDPFDKRGHESGLPPVDSLDLWPVISGSEEISPRKDFPMTPFGEDVRHEGMEIQLDPQESWRPTHLSFVCDYPCAPPRARGTGWASGQAWRRRSVHVGRPVQAPRWKRLASRVVR